MTQAELDQFVDDFVDKYKGKTKGFPTDSQYPGECLSIAKLYMQEGWGFYPPASGCNGARCYWSLFPDPLSTYFEKVAYTPGMIPKKGWVAVWNEKVGNGFGHIDIVVEAINPLTFVGFDQNWNGKQCHLVEHTYGNIYGFLKPKLSSSENGGGDMPTDLEKCKIDLSAEQGRLSDCRNERATIQNKLKIAGDFDLNKCLVEIERLQAIENQPTPEPTPPNDGLPTIPGWEVEKIVFKKT